MIARKRLEARISDEEVALARKQLTERNQKAAQLKKEEVSKYHLTVIKKSDLHKITQCFKVCKQRGN